MRTKIRDDKKVTNVPSERKYRMKHNDHFNTTNELKGYKKWTDSNGVIHEKYYVPTTKD